MDENALRIAGVLEITGLTRTALYWLKAYLRRGPVNSHRGLYGPLRFSTARGRRSLPIVEIQSHTVRSSSFINGQDQRRN